MKQKLIVICFFCSLFWNGIADTCRYPLIPLPAELTPKEGEVKINKATTILVADNTMKITDVLTELKKAVKSQSGIVLKESKKKRENVISFYVDRAISHPEGYKLSIGRENIEIRYITPHGAFNAVQTLRQLFPIEKETDRIVIPAVEISDYPTLGYRAHLIDVARHFMPFEYLKQTIDRMAFYKLNVLHLHLTDDQGWRFESKKYPKLHKVGAWRSETQIGHRTDVPHKFDGERHGGYYTQKELSELVEYAKKKFIRIIPEIDLPGHTHALLAAYPQLGCVEDTTYTVSGIWGYDNNILCPKEETFEFLKNLFDEVLTIFPDSFIHIGGDEVQMDRWKSSSLCQDFIQKNNLGDEKGILRYFSQFMRDYLAQKGRRMIGWDEILECGLPSDAIVMSWRGERGGIKGARLGNDVIMTPSAYMYLNFYNTDQKDKLEPLANTHALPLRKVYEYTPFPKSLNDKEKKHIIGLQGSLWTEYCKTPAQAESLTYPRLCAVAEVAWTPSSRKNYDDFYRRLMTNIIFLDRWGVNYSRLFINYK